MARKNPSFNIPSGAAAFYKIISLRTVILSVDIFYPAAYPILNKYGYLLSTFQADTARKQTLGGEEHRKDT